MISNLAEGTYTVTVTDANGCTASCTEEVILTPCCNVTEAGEIAADQENCGAFDPYAFTSIEPASGGIGTIEYEWLRGTCGTPTSTWTAIANSNSETYDPGMITETTCFVRHARNNGCEPWVGESNIITITVYPPIALSCNGIDGDCSNGNMATAIAHIADGTEPYSILWSNGDTTAVIQGLDAGTYTVTVTDANGCEAECSVTVTVEECCNVTDGGEIAASQENCGPFDPDELTSVDSASGGVGAVEYQWWSGPCPGSGQTIGEAIPAGFTLIPGATSENYDPLWIEETTCFIRVARSNGCEEWIGESNIITITVNPVLIVSCTAVNGNCENENLGTATVTVSGGPSPFIYDWGIYGSTASIGGLEAGTYSVTVTDANGCTASCSVDVTVEGCCNVVDGGEIAASQENCGPFNPDELTSLSSATGGVGSVEYQWWSGPCPGDDPTIGEAIPAGFTLIPGATSENYDPQWLDETTCFIRVARNEGCEEWIGESNIITITVNPVLIVSCTAVNGNCENENLGTATVT
ncbi:MAG: hypothetical protein GY753_08820, partial [Gammaproteobacteria bacterium]|nr:hypothetical protein [Gammaproteobacteria bacterium]